MTVASHTPTTWDTILSTTMHNYRKSLTDNIFNSRPVLNYLMSNGRVRKSSGGISIVEPIMATLGDTGTYSGWEPITVTPVDTATAAQYSWRQIYATIGINGLEEAQNNSKEMIVNLLEAKIMQAEESLKTMLNGMLLATETVSPGPLPAVGFHSLYDLVDDDDATPVGGIVPSGTEDWWKSIVTDGSVATDAAGLEKVMRDSYNAASDSGSDRVDALFTDAEVFGFYESTLTPQVRYTDVEKANLGFQNLMFKNVPMFWDFQAQPETILGLNSKYVGLCIHSDRDFAQSAFTDNLSGSTSNAGAGTAEALDARVSFITTYGNTTIRNRRRCFKITGIPEFVAP
jgi:hypothetical protein